MKDGLAALLDLPDKSISWLIVDHYGLSAEWQTLCKKLTQNEWPAPRLLVLDDLADRAHQADVLLDAIGLILKRRINILISSQSHVTHCLGLTLLCSILLISTVAILYPFTISSQTSSCFFRWDGFYHRSVAEGLLVMSDCHDLDVDVVIGPAAPHRAELEALTLSVPTQPCMSIYLRLPALWSEQIWPWAQPELQAGKGFASPFQAWLYPWQRTKSKSRRLLRPLSARCLRFLLVPIQSHQWLWLWWIYSIVLMPHEDESGLS